jgi:hypothetical protein
MVKIIQITNSIKNVFFDSIRFFLILLLIFTFCLWGCSCKKENNEPEQKKPEPTTDGRNTFYCEINGVPYYQKFVSGLSDFPRITGSFSNSPSLEGMDFTITYPKGNKSELFAFSAINLKGKLNLSFPSDSNYFCFYQFIGGCDYYSSIKLRNQSGIIRFSRLDHNAGIFSGSFSLKMWSENLSGSFCDTLKISNGIFDLKL